ncbi:hypothetical protein JCM10213_003681 [Rhodosporidiobolus nylandii]
MASDAGAAPSTTSATAPFASRTSTPASQPPQTGTRLFDLAHSRKAHVHAGARDDGDNGSSSASQHGKHLHEHHHPLGWKHLFKRPIVRQWLAGGVLVREAGEREAARFELFFDLVFVGIIHVLAERAAEETSSWSIFKFSVFFWLAYSTWQDVRTFINVSGTDDVPQRLYVLLVMGLLLGFSANASAVSIECGGTEEAASAGSEGGTKHAAAFASGADESPFAQLLGKREAHLGEPIHLGGECEFAEGWAKNVRGALAFYLVGKLVRVALLLFYGAWLPRFCTAHYVRAAALLVSTVWWLPLTALETPTLSLVLPIVAIGLELAAAYALPLLLKVAHAEPFNAVIQRWTQGQNCKGHITFSATGPEAGIHLEYLRCILGLILAYCLNWTYADSDGSRTFLHALRRHWFTSVCWQQLHFPLSAALILVSVAVAGLVRSDTPSSPTRWLFGGGLSIVMVVLTLLATLNKPLDKAHSALLHRNLRLLARLVAGVVFALLPLADSLSSTEILAVVVGVLVLVCVVETVGKIGSVADEEKVQRALAARTDEGERAPETLKRELGGLEVGGVEEGVFELTDVEKGEDDAGVEGDLGEIRVTKLNRQQRLAYAF